ncbi:uncharacterized protein [Cebidichthys violaceus]|uniref:uncharacterized protein n=1 Tax=Cebidichthys violaceus TaxID=271503 RepID=UPI0035CC41DA
MKTIYIFCCLLYAAGIEGARIEVEGFEGGEVSFQCSHRLAVKNDKYLCKDPCNDGEDKLVTLKAGGRVESGRITLVDSGDGVFTVVFSHLRLSDLGKYWCAVDRFGLDTFTEVHVTVKEAVASEATTAITELSPTWTYPNISNSTESTPGMDTRRPANLLTGTVLYATLGAVAMLTILMLAIIMMKHGVNFKPQPQVCSDSTDRVSADEPEADCDYDDVGEDVQSMKKTSELVSCSHYPKQNPPTDASTAVDCSGPLYIYDNICCSKGTEHSRHSAANVPDKDDINFVTYIKPLPSISGRTGEGCLRKHTNQPTATKNATSKPTESCTSNASACHCRSCGDSTEVRPRSLWFGLDVSGTM